MKAVPRIAMPWPLRLTERFEKADQRRDFSSPWADSGFSRFKQQDHREDRNTQLVRVSPCEEGGNIRSKGTVNRAHTL
jgi:hypothetical protein